MSDKIAKFITSLNAKTKQRLKEKLLLLKKDPFGMKDVKKMQGADQNVYRLRVGKIRIIYKIIDKTEVEIMDIDYRGSIY